MKKSIASLFMAIALLVSAGCTTEIGGVMNHPMLRTSKLACRFTK